MTQLQLPLCDQSNEPGWTATDPPTNQTKNHWPQWSTTALTQSKFNCTPHYVIDAQRTVWSAADPQSSSIRVTAVCPDQLEFDCSQCCRLNWLYMQVTVQWPEELPRVQPSWKPTSPASEGEDFGPTTWNHLLYLGGRTLRAEPNKPNNKQTTGTTNNT